ncbi:glutathione hydrolase 1 proenzyme-like [Mytilus galloprovincialis]|uniref:glutathione hydrolase 1 proenzyme-like n=1 Tax=Mytilus galloprovincialis TaxID=29158 RepID=UPI003F7BBAE5
MDTITTDTSPVIVTTESFSTTSLAVGESPTTTSTDMITTDTSPAIVTTESSSTTTTNLPYSILTVTSQTSTHTNTDVTFSTTERFCILQVQRNTHGRHKTVDGEKDTEPQSKNTPKFVSDSIEGQYRSAAVASDAGAPCARIGTHIMKSRHGSAVDAAIATLLCQCVSNLQSCGIGGGFFMTVFNKKNKSAYTIIARETAPDGANATMFDGRSSTEGGLAVGVPGEIRGYWLAHQIGGRLPWKELFQPSIKLCREGVVVGNPTAFAISRQTENIKKFQGLKNLVVNPDTGRLYEAGDILKRPKLARTLETIANKGVDAFYNGELSKDIAADIRDAGGIITENDLAGYTALVKNPLVVKLNSERTVFSPPPPSSGAIVQFILNILDGYNLNDKSLSCQQKEIVTWHRFIEAFKFGFAKRTGLGDGDGENEAFREKLNEFLCTLTSKEFADQIRSQISDSQTFGTDYYGPTFFNRLNSSGTSHLSVLAPNGDAVSVTSTINFFFGSKVVGSRTGIIFNNQMDDFSTPNANVPESPANFIKPGKRPLSSMSPTIIVGPDGVVNLVVGASGGTKIITSTVLVTVLTQWLGLSIKEAIDNRRLHHRLLPPLVDVERGFPQFILDGLVSRGHNITVQGSAGSVVQGILQRREGWVTANSDFRKEGLSDGF